MFHNKPRKRYSNYKRSHSRGDNNSKSKYSTDQQAEVQHSVFVPSFIVANRPLHVQTPPEPIPQHQQHDFFITTSPSPVVSTPYFPGNQMGSTEDRPVFHQNKNANSLRYRGSNHETSTTSTLEQITRNSFSNHSTSYGYSTHIPQPDSPPSFNPQQSTQPSAPPLSPNHQDNTSHVESISFPIPSAPPLESSQNEDSSKRFFAMDETPPPRYSTSTNSNRSDRDHNQRSRSRSSSRDSSSRFHSKHSSSHDSHGKRKFRENEHSESASRSKSYQRGRYDNSTHRSMSSSDESRRRNEGNHSSRNAERDRSSNAYSPSRPSSPTPKEINNASIPSSNFHRRSPPRDPRVQNQQPKENHKESLSPLPLQYFMKEFSTNPLRALELFFLYKKYCSGCMACNPRATTECTYKLCMVCCIKLGLSCKKHSYVVSPFSMTQAPSLDLIRSVDDETVDKVAAWYQSFVDPFLIHRYSRVKNLKINSASPNSRVDFGEEIYSQLSNTPDATGRIVVFRESSPVPCVHWQSGEFVLAAIPKQFRIPPFHGNLFAVLYQTCNSDELVKRAKSRYDLIGRIELPAIIPLICPLSGLRIKIPARSVECPHAQCFDLMSYLNHNRITCNASLCKLCEWNCPYCNKHMSFTSIGVDVKILNILSEDQTKDTLWIKAMNDEKLTEYSFLNYDQLMKQTIKHHSKEESWEQIKRWCFGSDEVEVGRIALSLKCPLTHKPIKLPCRSERCSHIQCFDLSGYVDYLRQIRVLKDESKWDCPICECKTSPSSLYVDDFILSITEACQEDKERVEIRKDGTWEVCQAPAPTTRANVKKNTQVVDLTLSDDEDIHEVSSSASVSQFPHANSTPSSVRVSYRPPEPIFPLSSFEPRSTWGSSWGLSSLNRPRSNNSWGSSNDSPAALLNQRLSTERQLQVMEDQVRLLAERDKNSSNVAPSQEEGTATVGVHQQLERLQTELQQLRRENEKLKERTRCVVCLDRDIGAMLLPCHHQCTCWSCAVQMKTCPVCRQQIQNRQRVFFG